MSKQNDESQQISNLITAEELRGDLESFPKNDMFMDQLLKIINAKKKLIKQARISLFTIILATTIYKDGKYKADYLKDISKDIDFCSLLDIVGKNVSEKYGDTLLIRSETECDTPIDEVNYILSIDYSPPSHFIELYNHLGLIEMCYEVLLEIPITINYLTLDLSLMKIIKDVYVKIALNVNYGLSVLNRLKKSAKELNYITNDKKTFVYEIYYRCQKVKKGMSLNAISKAIEYEFRDLQKKGNIPFELREKKFQAPGNFQIKRYLLENNNIMKDFIKNGRYWILQR